MTLYSDTATTCSSRIPDRMTAILMVISGLCRVTGKKGVTFCTSELLDNPMSSATLDPRTKLVETNRNYANIFIFF